jgi:hypothetical protein
MSEFKCVDCLCYWRDEEDDFPRCHFDGFGIAPCEQEEYDDYYNEEQ